MKSIAVLSALLAIGASALVQSSTLAQTTTAGSASESSFSGISNIPRPSTSLIDIQDQYIADNKVRVRQADAPDIGWLGVHENANGQVGDLLGYVALDTGTNKNLVVPLSRAPKTPTAYVIVHSGIGPASHVINTLGRYDPITYPSAHSPKAAIASFNIYPYRTGYVNMSSSTSTPPE